MTHSTQDHDILLSEPDENAILRLTMNDAIRRNALSGLTGDLIPAVRAAETGLINRVVPEERLRGAEEGIQAFLEKRAPLWQDV